MGSLVGVDITQGVGIVPFDVSSPAVDFVVSTTLKWLCGVSGAGILQVREDLLRECAPELRGWFSQENPFSWDLDAFVYAPDARRFDHGTPSILPFAACIPALDWHAHQSLDELISHNHTLVSVLLDEAPRLGLTLSSPREPERRGGSVMFQLPQGANPHQTIDTLRAASVFADCRGNTLRLSPGSVTTLSGVEHCVRMLHKTFGRHCRASGNP
jgi:selenocysteine lyase/cysteine desulfurase